MATRRRKAVRRTRKHRGGKLIGEGASAVVIDPPIQCKDGRDMSKYVTRVSKRANVSELISKSHKHLIEKLKEIDPSQKYFYYPEYCEPGALSQDNKLDGVTYTNKKYSELLLKGSEMWNPLMREKRSWKGFFKGKATGKKIAMTTKNEKQLKHLQEAVELMHKNKIVHGDLHGRNVVISAEDDLPRIIDFEHSTINSSEKKIEQEKEYFEDAFPSLDLFWRKSR